MRKLMDIDSITGMYYVTVMNIDPITGMSYANSNYANKRLSGSEALALPSPPYSTKGDGQCEHRQGL
jgi:hypothetical protein